MILIVEDNTDVNEMLSEALKEAGYETDSAYTGIMAQQKIKQQDYELVLLDLMLPYKSGDEVLRELRRVSMIPVIVISAKDLVGTKIDLLKLGADDYITKPFDLGEVVARVESTLRRCKRQEEIKQVIYYKDLVLDEGSKHVTVCNQELDLTAKEYQILELLLEHKDKVYTKANLYEAIWQEEYLGDDNAVKTHISNLRSKLKKANPEDEYIETVWGLGYRMYKQEQ